MDNTEKGYTFGLICGVLSLFIVALMEYTLLMAISLLPIGVNAILLVNYRNTKE